MLRTRIIYLKLILFTVKVRIQSVTKRSGNKFDAGSTYNENYENYLCNKEFNKLNHVRKFPKIIFKKK